MLQCVQFGVWIAYALVAYCYFGVGFAGYHAFGSATGGQIMYSLGHPIWVICVAEIMIIIHVCGSFQVIHPPPPPSPYLFSCQLLLLTRCMLAC